MSLYSNPVGGPGKQQLFCPGPVHAATNVKRAVISREIGHREEEFSVLLRSLNEKAMALFGVTAREYHPVFLTGSGTAANEAVLSSIVGTRKILVLSNGEFGNRLYETSLLHNPQTRLLSFEWTQEMDLSVLRAELAANPVDIIAMVHHETSTGMLNPVREIGKLAAKTGAILFVDAVSSAASDPLDLARCNVAFCSTSGGKAIGARPGVSIVVGRHKEYAKLAAIPARTVYLNLHKFYTYSVSVNQTPNTPAVYLLYGLECALANILEEGLEHRFAALAERASFMRQELGRMGLQFVIPQERMSSMLTTVALPEGIEFAALRSGLNERGYVIYGGKGPLQGRAFQVATIGELSARQIRTFVRVLRQVFTECGYELPKEAGSLAKALPGVVALVTTS
jgi:2-aminoethylphosphonate-pyruvate transaminase